MYELIIAGAGPAGMAAAVYAARQKVKALLVSGNIGGQPNETSRIENYLGYQYIDGPELTRKFWEQVKQFPIEMKIGPMVTKVVRSGSGFRVETSTREVYETQAVIMATGKKARRLDVPGEKRLLGHGVSYCSVCDGPIFQDMNVAVIGGGNSALTAAEDLTRSARHVYLISRQDPAGDNILIDKIKASPRVTVLTGHTVVEVEGQDRVEAITIAPVPHGNTSRLEVEGVFVEIGLTPNSEAVEGLAKLNDDKEIMVNCLCETGVPGLYAAGDVTDVPEKQIIVAAGEGAKALLQAHRYLQHLRVK